MVCEVITTALRKNKITPPPPCLKGVNWKNLTITVLHKIEQVTLSHADQFNFFNKKLTMNGSEVDLKVLMQHFTWVQSYRQCIISFSNLLCSFSFWNAYNRSKCVYFYRHLLLSVPYFVKKSLTHEGRKPIWCIVLCTLKRSKQFLQNLRKDICYFCGRVFHPPDSSKLLEQKELGTEEPPL